MSEYAILVSPSSNRVYADSARHMMRAEIGVFAETILDAPVEELSELTIGGVDYLGMRAGELSERDVAALSNLSSVYALFEVQGELLRPITVTPLDRLDSDLLTIQKYVGKTNEQFTKLLLNVTAVSTDRPGDFLTRPLRVLDPLCGRGTTLNQAAMYGFDAYGIDRDAKDFDAYSHFLRTWLKDKRLKHSAQVAPVRREGRTLGRRLDIGFGHTKEQYKAGEVRTIDVVCADTLRTREIFGRKTVVDVIVTDAPYGVQHGASRDAGLARSPLGLLEHAVPGWLELLRPGGALGMSWNTNTGDRDALIAILRDNGLDVLESEPYLGFAHRVDQAIHRDLVVARKPAS